MLTDVADVADVADIADVVDVADVADIFFPYGGKRNIYHRQYCPFSHTGKTI